MTPPATTPAARDKKPQAARSSGHRRTAGSGTSTGARKPPAPRRVSGPLNSRGAQARTARPASPRRPSGATRRATAPRPLSARCAAFVRALPDHSLLDRIVRGRAWIPLLGVLLAGIVAMQVEVLKLSATMGRALERGTALQSQNQELRSSVAALGDDQRIERLAASMGMVTPTPTQIKFLASRSNGQLGRALGNIHVPEASSFIAALPAAGPASATASGGTASTASTPGSTPVTGSTAPTSASVAPTGTASAAASVAPTTATVAPGVPATTGSVSSGSSSTPATGATTPVGG